MDENGAGGKTARATFGMSWFWFPEAQFGCVRGVIRTRVGFSGGSTPCPTYRTIGDHTETVDIEYDPSKISYSELLDIFWQNHDPTSSCSRQYMSAIFYHGEEQHDLANKTLQQESKTKNIATVIAPAKEFYNAEDYHQKYMLQKHTELMNFLQFKRGPELVESHVACRLNGYIAGYGEKADFEAEAPSLNLPDEALEYIRDNFKYTLHQ